MTKKKILLVALSLVCVAILAVGSTLAYFTDAEQAVNTMTVGDIDITLEEKMYDGSAWVDYEDNQVLYPVTQAKADFNKSVFTTNTSESGADVYIRTIITLPAALYDYVGLSFNAGANIYYDAQGIVVDAPIEGGKTRYAVDWKYAGDFTIDGELKNVFVCTVKDGAAVAKNDIVYSLCKVWLYETVTQEQVKMLGLDTAAFQVKVLSQGIQTYELTHDEAMAALGEINADNLSDWFN